MKLNDLTGAVDFQELNAQSCFNLLGAALYSAIRDKKGYAFKNKKKVFSPRVTQEKRKINIKFAKSVAIQMWCDVSGYDEKKVSDGIIKQNPENPFL